MGRLQDTSVDKIANPDVVVLNSTHSVREALQSFARLGIQSAPVYNYQSSEVLGSVDVLDLVTFVLKFCSPPNTTPPMLQDPQQFFASPLVFVLDQSRCNPFFPVAECTSIAEVVAHILAKGVHRCPVVDSQNEVVGIVSHIDVLTFVLNHASDFADLLKQSVASLGFVTGTVVAVSASTPLRDVFATIIKHGISAVAVVDEHYNLTGNLSASDLKGITEENWLDLALPVGTFLAHQHRSGAACCSPHTTLHEVITSLITCGIHRLYIVNELKKPVGIVSTTDLMKLLAKWK
jgi:5'-AMP-activated protein kinase regulatory gamma subunit